MRDQNLSQNWSLSSSRRTRILLLQVIFLLHHLLLLSGPTSCHFHFCWISFET